MTHEHESEWVRENLSSYIDDQLSADERRRVEDHLAQCAECQEELDTLRVTVQMLQRVPEAVPRRSFTLADEYARKPSPVFGIFRVATALAALMLVLVLSGDVLQGLGYLPASTQSYEADSAQLEITDKEKAARAPAMSGAEEEAVEPQPGASVAEQDEEKRPTTYTVGVSDSIVTATSDVATPVEEEVPLAEEVLEDVAPSADDELLPWRTLEMGLVAALLLMGTVTVWVARHG